MFSEQWQEMYWRNLPIKLGRIAVMHRGQAFEDSLNQNIRKVTDTFSFYIRNIAF